MSEFANKDDTPKRSVYVPPHLRKKNAMNATQPVSDVPRSFGRPVPVMNSRAAALAAAPDRGNRRDKLGSTREQRLAKFEADNASAALRSAAELSKTSDASTAPKEPTTEEDAKTMEEAERERHPDLFSEETVLLSDFYTSSSDVFKRWSEVRNDGYKNEHIGNFFEKKNANKSQKHREGAYVGANIGKIFCQFYRYAVDVDIGTYYTQRAHDIAEATGKCWFLDFGFSPGGMSDLLLNAHPDIHGVGVSLDPSKGGNVWLPEMDTSETPFDRFYSVIGDVIDMARADLDIPAAAALPDTFDGFDFVIIGITIHQEWHGENMNELKDLLHFAQLYFAFKYLKPGGMCLMRNHMSVRLVDAHMLALMISLFDIKKFKGRQVGKERIKSLVEEAKACVDAENAKRQQVGQASQGGKTSLSQLFERQQVSAKRSDAAIAFEQLLGSQKALDMSAVATKPFSTFSMRKTFWTLYQGFDCSDEKRVDLLDRLQQVLKPDLFAYGFNVELNKFNHPVLHAVDMKTLLEKYGMKMIAVLETVWCKQVLALEGFMAGKTDKFCRRGMSCNRRGRGQNNQCNLAHSDSDMIPEVLEALRVVNSRSRNRLMGFE